MRGETPRSRAAVWAMGPNSRENSSGVRRRPASTCAGSPVFRASRCASRPARFGKPESGPREIGLTMRSPGKFSMRSIQLAWGDQWRAGAISRARAAGSRLWRSSSSRSPALVVPGRIARAAAPPAASPPTPTRRSSHIGARKAAIAVSEPTTLASGATRFAARSPPTTRMALSQPPMAPTTSPIPVAMASIRVLKRSQPPSSIQALTCVAMRSTAPAMPRTTPSTFWASHSRFAAIHPVIRSISAPMEGARRWAIVFTRPSPARRSMACCFSKRAAIAAPSSVTAPRRRASRSYSRMPSAPRFRKGSIPSGRRRAAMTRA